MIIYHDAEFCEGQTDAEAAFPIAASIPETDRIKVYEIPRTEVAYLVYTGTYESVWEAHQAIGTWIADHGYRLAGPNRVVFLKCDDAESVVEIQYPVTK